MADQANQVSQGISVPWWGKIVAGVLGTYFIVKYTPIVELLSLFISIVCIPVGLIVSLGLISAGTMEQFTAGWAATVRDINARVEKKVQESRNSEDQNRQQAA